MRKLTPIPIIIMVVVSIVFASGVLFPDTQSLPRSPKGPGTIGGVLSSWFDSDGVAINTQTLSGVYASGYLQNRDCSAESINTTWVGVDADGQGVCGNTVGLLAIGSFSELHGTVRVSRDGGLNYNSVNIGDSLYEGDLIESGGDGTGTVLFAADNSLLRFSNNTDLELRYGQLDGQTVAEVILNDGRLWGRILSSTGVNLGGGGLVTGVRGTSIDIHKVASTYTMNVVSSTNADNKLYQVIPQPAPLGGGSVISISYPVSMIPSFGSGTMLTYESGAYGHTAVMTDRNPNVSYGDAWVRNNTIEDIEYMSDLLSAGTGSISAEATIKLNAELDNTLIQNNTGITLAMLAGGAITNSDDLEKASELLTRETELNNKYNARYLACKRQGKTYFPTAPNANVSLDYCNGSWNTLWTTMELNSGDYTAYSSYAESYTASGGSTNEITSIGKYMAYTLTGAQFSSITGKKITIELNNPVGHTNPSANAGTKFYIMDLGSGNQYFVWKNKDCNNQSSLYTWICKQGSPTNISIYAGETSFAFNIVSPSKFVIGALYTSLYNNPIHTSIKKISIK